MTDHEATLEYMKNEPDKPYIPSVPYGDPNNYWEIDRDDFYKFVDAAFDSWYAVEADQANLSRSMPYELTALEPPLRQINWREATRSGRERPLNESRLWKRRVHPEVAATVEAIEDLGRGEGAEGLARRPFSPSPLACFRAGFASGTNAERMRYNADALAGGLERFYLRRMISRDGPDAVRSLFERLISELEAEREAGICSHPQVSGHPCIRARQCPSCGAVVPPE